MKTIRLRSCCSVPGCPNTRDKGAFKGNICFPCYAFLRGGDLPLYLSCGYNSQAAKNASQREAARELVMKAQALDEELKKAKEDEPS